MYQYALPCSYLVILRCMQELLVWTGGVPGRPCSCYFWTPLCFAAYATELTGFSRLFSTEYTTPPVPEPVAEVTDPTTSQRGVYGVLSGSGGVQLGLAAAAGISAMTVLADTHDLEI